MNLPESAPRGYVTSVYLDYQARYASDLKESDKVFISLVRRIVERSKETKIRLLDIGCSAGNLLHHLRREFPQLELTGADLFPEIADRCRADPRLAGIAFDTMDLRALPSDKTFDIVIVSAVLFRFTAEEFAVCCSGIHRMLSPGGTLIAFDWYQGFQQDLAIFETSKMHPEGLSLHVRSFEATDAMLVRAGFATVDFHPFDLPIDLPFPGYDGDIVSYTRKEEQTGARMTFRGALYQPWCHLLARRA